MAEQDKPTPAAINLDKLEREGAPGEFPVILDGKRIVMSDAQEIDWQTLMVAMNDPHAFFRLIVPKDKQDAFFAARLPTWKMRALMDAYTEHYGLTSPGEAVASLR